MSIGGIGFIGKHFVQKQLQNGHEVINLDKLTYAADKKIQTKFFPAGRYSFLHDDIAKMDAIIECDVIALTLPLKHMLIIPSRDRAILPRPILLVQNMLEHLRATPETSRPLLFQISTDEVYGDLLDRDFCETDKLALSNPYSSTKAAADMMIESYNRTYGIDYKTIRG